MAKVIVIGGGVAGLSAAHELVDRGYAVEVFERNPRYLGGKARSVDAPGTNGIDPHLFLPGEHGFRFFPGYYQHVTDTMQRIPLGNGLSVYDNLVCTQDMMMAQANAKPVVLPVNFPASFRDVALIFEGFKEFSSDLTDAEIECYAGKVWQLMTSCSKRYDEEYDSVSWWDFTESRTKSEAYQRLLSGGMTRSLVACRAQNASTRTCGAHLVQMLYRMMNPITRNTDRVLNAPTNEAWLYPWYTYLAGRGVQFHRGVNITGIETGSDRISGVTYTRDGVLTRAGCPEDHFILAVPLERAANLVSEEMLVLAPALRNIIKLAPNVEWMNGIQFYLNAEVNINKGHTMYTGSNWALTSISQKQFWPDYDLSRRGNGRVVSILSVDVSNWEAPGNFNGKIARECTKDEVQREVWQQLKRELNYGDTVTLRDDMIEGYYLDEDIEPTHAEMTSTVKARLNPYKQQKLGGLINLEPLLVNQCDTWAIRPNAYTAIPNLFLAADYVKTHTDLATMEGANEAARRAVNSILLADEADMDMCEIWEMDTPTLLKPLQALDRRNFDNGLPWQHPL